MTWASGHSRSISRDSDGDDGGGGGGGGLSLKHQQQPVYGFQGCFGKMPTCLSRELWCHKDYTVRFAFGHKDIGRLKCIDNGQTQWCDHHEDWPILPITHIYHDWGWDGFFQVEDGKKFHLSAIHHLFTPILVVHVIRQWWWWWLPLPDVAMAGLKSFERQACFVRRHRRRHSRSCFFCQHTHTHTHAITLCTQQWVHRYFPPPAAYKYHHQTIEFILSL